MLELVDDATSRPLLGLGGPKSVNVLKLNHALEAQSMTDRPERSLFERDIMRAAIGASLRKLDPRLMARNPVMFVVEVGAVLTTLIWIVQAFGGDAPGGGGDPAWFTFTVAIWLWLTVLFGNFAEAIAEGRGKAQADTLRAMRTQTVARLRDGADEAGQRARAAATSSSSRPAR